ncbi:MAG: MFS transporter [Promethearchaeota archaeon]
MKKVERTSKFEITSYGFGYLIMETSNAIFNTYVFFFYETEVGLYIWLVTIAISLYSLWNAINDPLLGYLFDRPNRLWSRYGKRFPLIMLGFLPWFITLVLILSPPNVDPIDNAFLIFFWMLGTTCLYDTFYSLVQNNHYSLFPDKFRLDEDRRLAGGIGLILAIAGTGLGAIIPPLLINYGDKSSYSMMAWIMVIISSIFIIIMIPGIREKKEMIERYITKDLHKKKESFFTSMKKVIKQKNFMILVIITFIGDVAFACLTASIHYFVRYDLKAPAEQATIMMAAFLIGSLGSLPILLKIIQKIDNNRKMHIIGIILLTLFILGVACFWDLASMFIFLILLGIGMASFKMARFPCLGDSLDEAIINTKEHQESIYMGVQTFFLRLSLIVQSVIFAVVHELTGFNPSLEEQTSLALFGLRMQASIIPAVILFLGLIVFWKYYTLTPETTKKNKEILSKMKL